jgi:hypothetical protein
MGGRGESRQVAYKAPGRWWEGSGPRRDHHPKIITVGGERGSHHERRSPLGSGCCVGRWLPGGGHEPARAARLASGAHAPGGPPPRWPPSAGLPPDSGRSRRVAPRCGASAAGGGAGMTAERKRFRAGRAAWSVAQPQAHHETRHGDSALQTNEQGQMSRPPFLVGWSVPVGQELIAPDGDDHRLSDGHQAHEGTHAASVPYLATGDTCGLHRWAGNGALLTDPWVS